MTSLIVVEALAVLLQTWNKTYYQYRKFDNAHFASKEKLLVKHQSALAGYRKRMLRHEGRTVHDLAPASGLNPPNRRMRTRMSGGVAGKTREG